MTTKNLEIGLKHLIDKNEAACLNLVQKPTLRQAKISRLEANYYRFVTEDLPELTIADLRVMYDLKDVTLEELYEKLQTKLLRMLRKRKTLRTLLRRRKPPRTPCRRKPPQSSCFRRSSTGLRGRARPNQRRERRRRLKGRGCRR